MVMEGSQGLEDLLDTGHTSAQFQRLTDYHHRVYDKGGQGVIDLPL